MIQTKQIGNVTVHSDGTVIGARGKPVGGRHSCGYLTARSDGKVQLVHRLVAEAFIPNPDNKPEVNHIDGDKLNNDVSNLEWVSRSGNTTHAYRTGLNPAGEDNTQAKLSNRDAADIRASYKDSYYGRQSDIAAKYGVSVQTISKIIRGVTYKDYQQDETPELPKRTMH